uniref:Uncharacterized protein n=1 Tax=Anopheles melas TaxID=34690 RepID=A0A182TTP1_9DIPT
MPARNRWAAHRWRYQGRRPGTIRQPQPERMGDGLAGGDGCGGGRCGRRYRRQLGPYRGWNVLLRQPPAGRRVAASGRRHHGEGASRPGSAPQVRHALVGRRWGHVRGLVAQIRLALQRPRHKLGRQRVQHVRLLQLHAVQLRAQQRPDLDEALPYLPAAADRAERHRVADHRHQALGALHLLAARACALVRVRVARAPGAHRRQEDRPELLALHVRDPLDADAAHAPLAQLRPDAEHLVRVRRHDADALVVNFAPRARPLLAQLAHPLDHLVHLRVVVEGGRVFVLHVLAARREERERVELLVARLLAGRDQLLLVEQLGREADDCVVRPVVLAQQYLAREVVRVVVVQPLQQRHVQLALLRKVGEQLRRHLHVVAGQHDARPLAGKRERHDRLALHRLGRLVQEDVREVALRQVERRQLHRDVQRHHHDPVLQDVLHGRAAKVAHVDVQIHQAVLCK